ncbi:hypothetical protein ACFQGT_13740 [Natrialbaceae archaeon GCM10025810]|uniref:hypothetical protein n=1 Tax=Halovalidus salilacus TaxID=3075124 RepID=UPI0036236C5F
MWVGAWFLLCWLVVSAGRSGSDASGDGGEENGDADGESRSVWNAISRWQYDGRHAESGGLTRQEQAGSLAEIRREAVRRAPVEFRDRGRP